MHHLHHKLHHPFRHAALAVTVFSVMAALVSVGLVGAANLDDVSDTVSRHAPSTAANHIVEFDTPTGAAMGTDMILTFSTAFDTSSITENDVDVEEDGVDLTTAADCTGLEEASVVMAGDALTITICPGDGGTIDPNDTVTVEIGTIATASGTGTNQIINPPTVGTYPVGITGTFGDDGVAHVPVIDSDQVGIFASVSSGGTGGPGPGPCDTDHTAPNITNGPTVTGISSDEATVNWSTDESSTSFVDYGLTDSYELGSASQAGLTTNHVVALAGLTLGTTYHYRVTSTDNCGNTVQSGDNTFTTLGQLTIYDVQVINITETSATIVWYTSKDADSELDWGLTDSYGTNVYNGADLTAHSVPLSGLTPDTLYHYQITAESFDGDTAQTIDLTFTTLPIGPPPNVINFSADPAPDGENIIDTWENPDPGLFTGEVIYRRTDGFPTGPGDGDLVWEGIAEEWLDTDVIPGVIYYYCIYTYNEWGLFSSGACDDAFIEVPLTIVIKAEPEKRWPRESNWHTDFTLSMYDFFFGSLEYEVTLMTNDETRDGRVDVFALPLGTYDLSGKGLSHLTEIMHDYQLVEGEQTLDFTYGDTQVLHAGDTDPTDDDDINSLDISGLLAYWLQDNEKADQDQESQVNSLDLNILITNYFDDGELRLLELEQQEEFAQ